MTSTEETSTEETSTEKLSVPKQRPPPPLQTPSFVRSNSLTAALYDLFSLPVADVDDEASELKPKVPFDAGKFLNGVVATNLTWSTPLFETDTREQYLTYLTQFFNFAIKPTLAVYSVRHTTDQSFTFEWTLSFLYPLPWRPRVSISAISTAITDQNGHVVKLTDDWLASPWSPVIQALPPLPDILWLWPAPHAESDRGSRRLLKKTRNYSVIEMAPRAELRIRDFVETNSRELVYAVPVVPEKAFEGGLRRKEFYSTIKPISIRELDDDGWYEWAIAVPGAHAGTSSVPMQAPMDEGVTVETVDRRIFAVRRFGGFSSREKTRLQCEPFIQAIKEDGLWEGDVVPSDVWVRTYDVKVGFNSSGLLSMAMYGYSRGVSRVNEIAIDITRFWRNSR